MPKIRTTYNAPKNEDDFELLCLKLLRRKWNAPGLVQHGKRGERQYGIDLLDPKASQPLRAAQCKLREAHKTISPAEIENEVEMAKGAPFKLDVFTIATTAKPSGEAQRKVMEINQEHQAQGLFLVELLHWRELEDLLDEYADVRDEFYGGLDAQQAARLSGQIQEVKEAVQVATASDKFKTALQDAKQAIDEHDYPVAKRLLERLQQDHWDELGSIERCQLLTRLGVVRLAQSSPNDAARLFLRAKDFNPEDEKALINEALAYYLLGDLARAHRVATDLRHKFHHSAQLTAVWVNSSPSDSDPVSLMDGIDPHLRSEGEVAVALAARFAQRGDSGRAETVLRSATSGKTEWSILPLMTGRAILASELDANSRAGARDNANYGRRLREAEELFSLAAELAEKEKQPETVGLALVDRANVRRLLGEDSIADRDVEQAFLVAPDESSVIAQMSELERRRGNANRAVEAISRASLLSPERIDIKYTLASALRARGKPGDYARAAELMREVALATPSQTVVPGGREHAISIAIDCLGRDGRWDEANKLLSSLPNGFLNPVAGASMRGNLALQQKDGKAANKQADEALSLIPGTIDRDSLAYLATLLNDLGRHKEALPLWQRVVRPGEPGPDPRRLLDTAYRLGRHDVILDTCEQFRSDPVRGAGLLPYEVAILEQYDAEGAIRRLQEHLNDHPEDCIMRLRLSMLGIRMNRQDLIDAEPAHMPPVEDVDPAVGFNAVRVMKLAGRPDAALSYAYDLLRRHFDDVEAHRAYTLVFLPLGPTPTIEEFQTAEAGAAVCYVEDNTVDQRWIVIEDVPSGTPRFNNEVPTSGYLARELAGKRTGDEFLLASAGISQRVATIIQVLNKYVYRYQDCMGQWQVRFPDVPDIQSVHLRRRAPDGELDVSEILRAIDRRHEAADELESLYRSKPVPIHMFAAALGNDAFKGVHFLAYNPDSTLFCCAGTQEERDAAIQAVQVSTNVILDLTSIATLIALQCTDLLSVLPASFVVSQATMTELQDLLSEEELSTARGGTLSKTKSGYAWVEATEENRKERITALSNAIDLLRKIATIAPCRELAALESEKRSALDHGFGRYGAEAIVLASTPGRVLWTDDNRQARFAMTEHGVRSIWTQAMLQYACGRGRATLQQYLDASAKLLGFGYRFTSSNPQILMRAGTMAEWDIDRWPFKQALDEFKADYIDTVGQLQLATLFALQLYREPVLEEIRNRVLIRVLDNLATRPDGLAGIQALQQAIPRIFGLNAVGAQQCATCIKRWLEGRSIKIIP